MLAGDNADADAAVKFLFNHQQQADGHFPQNSFVDGTPSWTGIQMDETAYPIILAWQLHSYDATLTNSTVLHRAHPAGRAVPASRTARRSNMERWEENAGYSPSTIAAEIAGMYLASQIATPTARRPTQRHYPEHREQLGLLGRRTGPTRRAGRSATGSTSSASPPTGSPNDATFIVVANGGGTVNQNALVDNGFLQLVILGILPANDLHVANTIAVTANPNVPASRPARSNSCSPTAWTSTATTTTGTARPAPAAPFVSGRHRAAVADPGRRVRAVSGPARQQDRPVRDRLAHFATSSYLVPEQVWNLTPPAGDTPGTPTQSMSALNWSLSMYIQLVAAEYDQVHSISGLPGAPAAVVSHFAATLAEPVVSSPSPAIAGQPVTVVYHGTLAAPATSITMHWGHDNWLNVTDTPMTHQTNGTWTATVTVPAGTGLNTAFFNQASTWDSNGGANYNIGAINAPVSTSPVPIVGAPVPRSATTARWPARRRRSRCTGATTAGPARPTRR